MQRFNEIAATNDQVGHGKANVSICLFLLCGRRLLGIINLSEIGTLVVAARGLL